MQKENWLIAGRCWYMAYKLWKKLPKHVRDELVLVEGVGHYWLEDSESNVYDIYAEMIDHEYNYNEVEARYDLSALVLDDDNYEDRPADHIHNGNVKWVQVGELQNLEEARLN